jgi:hypothetical protein
VCRCLSCRPFRHLSGLGFGLGLADFDDSVFESVALGANLVGGEEEVEVVEEEEVEEAVVVVSDLVGNDDGHDDFFEVGEELQAVVNFDASN